MPNIYFLIHSGQPASLCSQEETAHSLLSEIADWISMVRIKPSHFTLPLISLAALGDSSPHLLNLLVHSYTHFSNNWAPVMCVCDGYKKNWCHPQQCILRWEGWVKMLWKYMHRRQALKPAWEVWEDVADEVSLKLILKARVNLD